MKTILIIEDNDIIRENLEEILSLAHYNVLLAENGKAGIDIATEKIPDMIISDIMMPGIDGYGVLHVLNKDPKTQNIPFIFLTSKSERSDFRAAMEMGADDYITKPFNGNELLNAIESRFKKIDITKKNLSPDLSGLNELMSAVASKEALDELATNSNVDEFKKKHVIYKDGNHPYYLYYIISGKVKTYKTHEDGKDLVIGLYKTGDFLGYVPLLENSRYTETAEAMEDCEIAMIPKKEFEELINCNHEVAKKFISLLSKNIAEKEDQLLGIAYNTLRKKVAGALLSLLRKYHIDRNDTFTINITRDELASIAGTATESLIRTLSDFKSERLIEINEGKIAIPDSKRLENLIR